MPSIFHKDIILYHLSHLMKEYFKPYKLCLLYFPILPIILIATFFYKIIQQSITTCFNLPETIFFISKTQLV